MPQRVFSTLTMVHTLQNAHVIESQVHLLWKFVKYSTTLSGRILVQYWESGAGPSTLKPLLRCGGNFDREGREPRLEAW